jgi:hypothetical protein
MSSGSDKCDEFDTFGFFINQYPIVFYMAIPVIHIIAF